MILFVGSLIALWIPVWFIRPAYWIAHRVLYAIHTIMNICYDVT